MVGTSDRDIKIQIPYMIFSKFYAQYLLTLFKQIYERYEPKSFTIRNMLVSLSENNQYRELSNALLILGRKISCEHAINYFKDDLIPILEAYVGTFAEMYRAAELEWENFTKRSPHINSTSIPESEEQVQNWNKKVLLG